MFIPLAIVRYQSENASSVVQQLMDNRSLLYNVVYVILVIAFYLFLYSYYIESYSDG